MHNSLIATLLLALLLLPAGCQAAEPALETWTEPVTGMVFLRVEPGCFQMGQGPAEAAELHERFQPWAFDIWYRCELPRHEVCLDGYWLGRTEVTRGQWSAVMTPNMPEPAETASLPVVFITWVEAMDFCERLGKLVGAGAVFRLPSEAEWERACRAGCEAPFGCDETITAERANYHANYVWPGGVRGETRGRLTPVGSFPPNAWGFQDMHGNAAEWCLDGYDEAAYAQHPRDNPNGPDVEARVIRGGNFADKPWDVRCASRGHAVSRYVNTRLGFRVARAR